MRIAFYKVARIIAELSGTVPASVNTRAATMEAQTIRAATMEAQALLFTAYETLVPSSSFRALWQEEMGAATACLSFTLSDPLQDLPKRTPLNNLNQFADLFALPCWRLRRKHILLRQIKDSWSYHSDSAHHED
jgi:hypothetical protein